MKVFSLFIEETLSEKRETTATIIASYFFRQSLTLEVMMVEFIMDIHLLSGKQSIFSEENWRVEISDQHK
jgi:hypothetical protein